MRALLICPYFGDLPPWWDRYQSEEIPRLAAQDYDVYLNFNEADFDARVREKLGFEPPPMFGTGKIWDFRPALGLLYHEEIEEGGYDWWGHTDFDCVYGRQRSLWTLGEYDAFTDCVHGYMAGPWSLYRNHEEMRTAFTRVPGWMGNMLSPEPTGWCETTFSEMLFRQFDVLVEDRHGFTHPELLHRDGNRLMHRGREIPMYHFRRTKVWPL